MADKDQDNDEYKFTELDSLDNESMEKSEHDLNKQNSTVYGDSPEHKNIRRNALIAVGLILFAMLMYKFIGSMFSGKTVPVKSNIPPVTQITTQPQQTVITPTPIPTPTPIQQAQIVPKVVDNQLQQKVSAIELSQQSIRDQVSSVSNQVGSVNSNISDLNTQLAKLNQIIESLSMQITKQSEEITALKARSQPRHIKPVIRHIVPRINYNLQAIIPGRAWLIGSNGTTLTVREGTMIPGYGTVRLIDAVQGRVLTSSGRVIKFSQEDS